MLFLEKEVERNKKMFPNSWEKSTYKIITQKGANDIKNMIKDASGLTACGFAMVRQKEDYIIFEEYFEIFGLEEGAKLCKKFIKNRMEEFEELQEKFPKTKEIKQKY